jgi:hypothetical protein
VALHEYLHYVSDTGDAFPPFLEEGMTEYFKQKLLSSVMLHIYPDAKNQSGESYREEVQVIKKLEEKMSPEKILSIYFNKNISKFSQFLGKVKYQTFLTFGDRLYYLPLDSISQRNIVYAQIQSLLDN